MTGTKCIRRASALPENHHIREILDILERDPTISQRALSSRVGIALGMTNLLLKRLVAKGWICVVRVRRNRVRYVLTPAGDAERVRMSDSYLRDSVRFYTEARNRMRKSFATLSGAFAAGQTGAGSKRIVFFGTSELAEIGYICLQETDLQLVAAIGDHGRRDFFGVPVHPETDLTRDSVGGTSFDRLVVLSFGATDTIRDTLVRAGFPEDKVFWI